MPDFTFKYYTTKEENECPWEIARKFYGSGKRVDLIEQANPEVDIDRIPAGTKLRLPGRWGKIETTKTPEAFPKPDLLVKHLNGDDYYAQHYFKDLIVLHFTAGRDWKHAWNTFAREGHVATQYIIDDNEDIICECFPPKYWAYALGVKGGAPIEKRAIQIELVNMGWLIKQETSEGTIFVDYTGRKAGRDRIYDHGTPWRKYRYWISFPDEQIRRTVDLLNWLLFKFKIPRKVLPGHLRNDYCLDIIKDGFKGVVAHHNVRKDKWDIGPAFPWKRVMEECFLTEA